MRLVMKKIYIVANDGEVTGGPQSLHQLAYLLKRKGYCVKMYYHNNVNANIPDSFKNYGLEKSEFIDDNAENVIIVPETLTHVLAKYKSINKCIWWLSLDFYLLQSPLRRGEFIRKKHGAPLILAPLFILREFFNNKTSRYKIKNDNTIHLYNCEYIKNYLLKHGIDNKKMSYLCGPLSDNFFVESDFSEVKQNIVLFNPKKGYNFTKKIIEYFNEKDSKIEFIPIQNMTQSEVSDIMARAKVYMDFGFFPGPERLPREAVMMQCNIITSDLGSANYYEDVKIPEKYKIKPESNNIPYIYEVINQLINNYDKYVQDYDLYRDKVILQKKEFSKYVSKAEDLLNSLR